ncbi:prenyltransferase/squalene oxidase repeat-containing protein [Streptomyces maremycinicus]|uniref:prenyltransferase/squalene oxidase repeat-containing protein n=1 Tax=Streptomyces maremycinicus TaxID=1679753 RepID=UPI00078792E5|nr:prenyltransferase/squalene oxidase repeat-containing protein [Streptomyces sp. NBRC 110468]
MNIRRSAAALAAVTVVLGAAVPAVAATPSPTPSVAIPDGLYGTTDPTYDGVWRQSLALLAQRTTGVTPADRAVAWLTGQQCANGAFAAYRADTTKACDAKLMVDTNSTAAAVQALTALGGHQAATDKAVSWLKSVQNADGGWGYTPGGASDANSTSVVAGAMAAAGEKPSEVRKGGKSSYDALLKLSIKCDVEPDGGAFAYQPDKKGALAANADATAAGVLGVLGKGFVTTAGKTSAAPACDSTTAGTPSGLARNGAFFLESQVRDTGYLKSALPGAEEQPDYGNTADAVVALAAQGATGQAKKPLAWLEQNSAAWAKQSGPAAYAQLIFAAHAMGADPRDFGGADLVAQLDATGPAPQATAKATDQAADADKKDDKKDDSDAGYGVWWTVGVFLVAGIGIGFLISGRGRKQQP